MQNHTFPGGYIVINVYSSNLKFACLNLMESVKYLKNPI